MPCVSTLLKSYWMGYVQGRSESNERGSTNQNHFHYEFPIGRHNPLNVNTPVH